MKNILLIGVGGTGSKAVDIFFQKRKELGDQAGNNVTALVFDTDAGDLKRITAAKTVVMADNASVGTICDRFGVEYLKEWFPWDNKAVRSQEMLRGASQWRKKSYLAFLNLMNKPLAKSTFVSALESMTTDPSASCEVYIIASVAGGTGSGSFIPIALYAKRYLRKTLGKDPIVNAMIALPDIYADSQTPENRIKVYSNAYAILRELNAINLVARNYNAGLAEHKKAPIRFRIGDPNEPSVGLLFDASDKQFWTPEAAPFSQIFLLDRIPNLNTVAAHDIVLANSLYTILCTGIGAAFDSEFSNHELLRSQSNGSNAIYAGISTSQIRFPRDSVLDYLAHKKTVDSCDSEWLTLHNKVERCIRDKEEEYKSMNRRYTMKDGEYAKIVVEQLEILENSSVDSVISIAERAIYKYDEEGKKEETTAADTFIDVIDTFIGDKIASPVSTQKELEKKVERIAPKGEKLDKDMVPACGKDLGKVLFNYYKNCLDDIRRVASSTADAIITLDKKKVGFAGKEHSVIDQLLKKNDKYIHPVAALILLCQFRNAVTAKLEENKVDEWPELKQRNVFAVPSSLLMISGGETISGDPGVTAMIKSGRGESGYKTLGDKRFDLMSGSKAGNTYAAITRTNARADLGYIWQDARIVLDKIHRGAQRQLRHRVYLAVAASLDLLIAKYRSFFNRFEKEKEDLVEQTKTAYRKDATNVDSIINVYSTFEDKDRIYKTIVADAGPATAEEIAATDDIVGEGVFVTVYNSAASEFSQDNSWNEKDSSAYRSLFDNMVKAYKKSIMKSEQFEKIASFNAIEALVASCGENPEAKEIDDAFKARFSVAQELATPSLRLDANERDDDLVRPSNIMVFMMSKGTGKYLKKHADEFGLHLPADQTKEDEVIKACAEEFIRRYSGNNSARVSIVPMSDQVLYCTGEIMDITPLRIAKFNELGEDNVYFKNYSVAIANCKKYGTDMWNPHLGNNLHKRGYLPYMNPEKERQCDRMVVKALLYAFFKGIVRYQNSTGARDKYYFTCNGKKITDSEGRWINQKNIAQLLSWIRNEDELAEEWSAMFDKEIKRQMNLLPSLASDNAGEISNLEASLTNSDFMRSLTDYLYADPSATGRAAKRVKRKNGKIVLEDKVGPTAIEFAYMVKTSEEIGRDCDDAERILDVVYDVFKELCEHRTNAANNPERFIIVYKQQLENFYEAVATTKTVMAAGAECKAHFNQFVNWLHDAGVFNTISEHTPMDDKGNVCIDTVFDFDKAPETRGILDYIERGCKGEFAVDTTIPAAVPAEVPAAEKTEETEEIEETPEVTDAE